MILGKQLYQQTLRLSFQTVKTLVNTGLLQFANCSQNPVFSDDYCLYEGTIKMSLRAKK